MTKNLLTVVICTLTVSAAVAAVSKPWSSSDTDGVESAVRDYVQAFYEAKPELLERSVSKSLKKMGYWRKSEEDSYSEAMHMTFEEAVALAKKWNADGGQGEDLTFDITVFEVNDKTACAKVIAKWGVDYFQLVNEDGKWMIHHVLWQSHPPTTEPAGE